MDYFYKKDRDPAVSKYFDKEMLDAWDKFDSTVFRDGKLNKKEKSS